MFVPVACLKCGKPFQVPEAAAGTTVTCPWCKTSTPALPVAGLPDPVPAPAPTAPPAPVPAMAVTPPVPRPVTTPAAPLSLDDDAPLAAPKAPFQFPFKTAIVVLLLSVACGLGTFFVFPWVRGWFAAPAVDLADAPWAAFTPPDGAFSVSLPGNPAEESLPIATGGPGSRFVVKDEKSGWSAWVGWRNLDPHWARKAITDQAWADLRPVFDAEVQQLEKEWDGKKTRQETIKFADPLTIEVDLDSPRGKIRERLILAPDPPRPRVYFVGIAARNLDPAGPAAQRFFGSFRVNKG
ncbi:MAG TPA: hypothetical protein VKE74_04075 [Gemmataceae bacterium]|nr:hypothetical protein [Gemmataceae bacterium]